MPPQGCSVGILAMPLFAARLLREATVQWASVKLSTVLLEHVMLSPYSYHFLYLFSLVMALWNQRGVLPSMIIDINPGYYTSHCTTTLVGLCNV